MCGINRIFNSILSKTHPLNIAIETEDVENAVCIDLERVESVDHDDGGVGLSGVIGRGAVTVLRTSITRSTTGPAKRWPHPPALVVWGRGAVCFIIVPVAALGTTCRIKYILINTETGSF